MEIEIRLKDQIENGTIPGAELISSGFSKNNGQDRFTVVWRAKDGVEVEMRHDYYVHKGSAYTIYLTYALNDNPLSPKLIDDVYSSFRLK